MRNLIVALCCTLSATNAWSQQPEKSILTDINMAQKNLPRRPTMVYTYVTWCGGNADDIETIHDVLKEYRDNYNFIVLIDSANQAKTAPSISDLKPDAYVFLNPYYPTCFFKKKEYKQFAKDFNLRFGANEVYMGPGSSYIMDCDSKLIKVLNEPDRVNELRNILKGLAERCTSN